MTDPSEALEMLMDADEQPLDPFVEFPDGYGLYEVVYVADCEPREVRRYVGEDMVPRVVSLVEGGVRDVDEMTAHMDPDEIHTRLIATAKEDAVVCLEGALDMGEFQRVDSGE